MALARNSSDLHRAHAVDPAALFRCIILMRNPTQCITGLRQPLIFTGYIDESGTHAASPVTIMAGARTRPEDSPTFKVTYRNADDIIGLLSNEGSSLGETLVKTKILLHKIGKKELAEWVNCEINGYPDNASVPEYRVLQSKVLANFSNGAWRYEAHPIPIGHIKPENRRHLENAELRQSLSVIENFGTKGFLQRDLPVEGNAVFEEGMTGGYHIERTWGARLQPMISGES